MEDKTYLIIDEGNIVINHILLTDENVITFDPGPGNKIVLSPGNIPRGSLYTSSGFIIPESN